MNLQKVGKFIAKMRKKVGMTQSDLGEALGVSGKAVSKWERGLNAPDIQVLVELAKLLNVTATEILVGEKLDNDITTEEANEIAISSINTYNNYSKKKYTKIILVLVELAKLLNVTATEILVGEKLDNDITTEEANEIAISSINTYNNYSKKKYTKIILVLVSIIILILTVFSTTYFITNYNKCFVYKLSSADNNYYLEGLIASNQKENSIIITGIVADDWIELNDNIDNYKVELKINSLVLYSEEYEVHSESNHNILDNIDVVISNSYVIPWNKEKTIGKSEINLYINFYNEGNEIGKITIPIKIEKKFSNDKLFY